MFCSISNIVSFPIASLISRGKSPLDALIDATREAKVFGSSFFLNAYAMCLYKVSFWSHESTNSVIVVEGSPTNIVFLRISSKVFTLGCRPTSLRKPS